MTLLGLPTSTPKTEVTLGVPSASTKHEPGISRFCPLLQSPSEGVAEITTGALIPRSIGHVSVCVNGPKTLSSLSPKVLVNVIVVGPPQHAKGNAVPGVEVSTGIVACRRSRFTTVMFLNGIDRSDMPSPLASQAIAMEVGVKPHPTKSSVTSQSAFMIPTVDRSGTAG